VWQSPDRNPNAINGFVQFMLEMAQLASRYLRNRLMREMAGEQALWTKLEAFTRQIHNSLNPIETAYLVANEGRRLIDCDRISVGMRYDRRCKVEAVSGADVVERRSNLVQLMRKLFDRVLALGEKLVYTGTKEEGLSQGVYEALDAYLAESNSKFLVVLPLTDERDKESKKPPRSVLMMECFEPAASPEQLLARLEVVGKHAASALYNCVLYRRIPFRFLWLPLARVQEGLGGKARAITAGICAALLVLIGALILVPYPLKMDATGSLLPEERATLFSPIKGHVQGVAIEPNDKVKPGQNILLLYDVELARELIQLDSEILRAGREMQALESRMNIRNLTPQEQQELGLQKISAEATFVQKREQRRKLMDRTNAVPDRLGYFWLRAPQFADVRRVDAVAGRQADLDPVWTVLTPDFKETLPRRPVEPKDPLLRLGNKQGHWEIELKIPQKHIGQVLSAFRYVEKTEGKKDVLDVDLIVKSAPTQTFQGKLERSKIAGEASPHRDDNNEAEPVVMAWVRIDGDDIPASKRVPSDLLLTGTEVHAKVRCGAHRMGYSLFYGVWEWIYEKVVFFF
jgi:hypothetical protein